MEAHLARRWGQPVVTLREDDDTNGEPDKPSENDDGGPVHRVVIARLIGSPKKASASSFC